MLRFLRARSRARDEPPAPPVSLRDWLAMRFGIATLIAVVAVFIFARDAQFLMPGPLSSPHAAIEGCSSCHTGTGNSKVGWIGNLIASDHLADSQACLGCHKMPETAFNPHGAANDVLQSSTERLLKVVSKKSAPLSARAQSHAFPTSEMMVAGLACANCHQEHKGATFDLKRVSNEQCRACHVVKFDSFDGRHPEFAKYPSKQRTAIIYDHESHFGKHFPEVASKDPAKRIPETCSSCHTSGADKRFMAQVPFEKTCAGCHQEQITGKDRASGPKGIAFLSLPGLDLATLRKKNAAIGEWPAESEAELAPFMKIMIGRNERGRGLLKGVDKLNLQDLSKANDSQIRSVTNLVWEIKGIFYDLIRGKASDVLADMGVGGGAKLSASLVADLTASLPRDVVIGAQQQWLPNLGTEMAGRKRPDARADAKSEAKPEAPPQDTGGWITTTTETKATVDSDTGTIPVPFQIAQADTGRGRALPVGQSDDLLNPTEDELRGVAAPAEKGGRARPAAPAESVPAPSEAAAATPSRAPAGAVAPAPRSPARAVPVVAIESSVDPESWAEYGGWYRQDFAIFYRPAGHKDKFIYSWLFLTGPQAPKGSTSPAAAVFNVLASKDAQGACTKCHSVDDTPRKGRMVNFAKPSAAREKGRFTQFIHEPHFAALGGVSGDRGCLTCHAIEKGRPYLKSYEQGNPRQFASSFGEVKKELCQTCHTSNVARQDCMTCHKYHVNGVVTPIMQTRIPKE